MARKRSRNKPNATGRNPTGRFVALRYPLLESVAYRGLAPNARALLIELAMLYNGENNGGLYLALRDAAARIGVADPYTAARAFDELEERGFITMTRDAHFRVKASEHSRARAWRLNHLPGPGRRIADWAFLDRHPPARTRANKRAERGSRALKAYRKARDAEQFPGVEFSHCEADLPDAEPDPVRNFYTGLTEDRAFAGHNTMGNLPNYIANQGGAGAMPAEQSSQSETLQNRGGPNSPLGWWQPDNSEALARLAYAASLAKHLGANIGERKLAA